MKYNQEMDLRTQALFLLAAARNFQPRHHDLLISQLGSLDALVGMDPAGLDGVELQGGLKQRLKEVLRACDPAAELAKAGAAGISVVGWGGPEYPELLAECPDAPLMLFCRGDVSMMRHHGIAIVGSRKCSDAAKDHARRFGRGLGDLGVPVVSGMALGIDGAAHEGALEMQGPTVAVLGCGVDVVYPPQHRELYGRLCEAGLVISEYLPGTSPNSRHFPQRNRIISGLSKGTLVVEAPMGSGALITARIALEQRREVFAVPGPVGSPYTSGVHHLIKHGQAKLTENVDDILVEFGTNRSALLRERQAAAQLPFDAPDPAAGAVAGPQTAGVDGLAEGERKILEILSYEGTHVNELVRRLGLDTAECVSVLTILEIKGLISASGSGFYTRI